MNWLRATFVLRKPHTYIITSRRPVVFLEKGVVKIYNKFTREHPRRSVISINLISNFIEITLRYGCCPVNLLHIFRTPFLKNTSGRLLPYHVNTTFWDFIIFLTKVIYSSVWHLWFKFSLLFKLHFTCFKYFMVWLLNYISLNLGSWVPNPGSVSWFLVNEYAIRYC